MIFYSVMMFLTPRHEMVFLFERVVVPSYVKFLG